MNPVVHFELPYENADRASWQIVPQRIADWVASRDTQANDRAFQAIMRMRKVDIAALDAAFAGR